MLTKKLKKHSKHHQSSCTKSEKIQATKAYEKIEEKKYEKAQ